MDFQIQSVSAFVQLQSWPTPQIFINSMSFPALAPDGSITNPSYAFASEPGLGIYRGGAANLRIAGGGQDLATFSRFTSGGLTNQATLGVGIAVPLAPFHIVISDATVGSTDVFSSINTNATDGNGCQWTFRANTTGGGATNFVNMGALQHKVILHDNATRSSQFTLFWVNSTVNTGLTLGGVTITPFTSNTMDLGSGALPFRAGYFLTSCNTNLLQAASGSLITIDANVSIPIARTLKLVAGANQRAGDATLVAGTVTVTCNSVTANTRVYLSRKTAGGTMGFLSYTLSAGVSFTITSANAADTSVVSFLLVEVA